MASRLKRGLSLTDRLGAVFGAALLILSVGAALSSRQPQQLPLAVKLIVEQKSIDLEVARTSKQQSLGLKYRSRLVSRGMLFPVHPPQRVKIWMKDVFIPLDIIFLRDGRVVAIAENVPPCRTRICPLYQPPSPVDSVVELPAGSSRDLGLVVGRSLLIVD